MTDQLSIEKTITEEIDGIERTTYYYLTFDFKKKIGEYVRIDYPVIVGEPPEVTTIEFNDFEITDQNVFFYLYDEYQGSEHKWAVPEEIWEALLKIYDRLPEIVFMKK